MIEAGVGRRGTGPLQSWNVGDEDQRASCSPVELTLARSRLVRSEVEDYLFGCGVVIFASEAESALKLTIWPDWSAFSISFSMQFCIERSWRKPFACANINALKSFIHENKPKKVPEQTILFHI